MQIENEFDVAAPPERVYAFLLDVNRISMPDADSALASALDSLPLVPLFSPFPAFSLAPFFSAFSPFSPFSCFSPFS